MVRVLVRSPKTSMDQCMVALPCAKLPWHQTAKTWKSPYFGMDSGVVQVNTLVRPWMHLFCPSREAPGWLGRDRHLGVDPAGSFSPRDSHPNSWLGASTSGSGQTPLILPAPPASASFVSQPSSAGKCHNLDTHPFRNHKANRDLLLPPVLSPLLSLRAPLSKQMFHAISPRTGKEINWHFMPLMQIYSGDQPGTGSGAAARTPGGGCGPALMHRVI